MPMSADQSPVTTDVNFEREGKQTSYLRVPYSRNNSAWGALLVPITVIARGAGPTVLLVGGNHGGEYEGPVALLKLGRELQPPQIQGRVILLPALNLPAVRHGSRLSPIDDKDMNRSFPGRADGTVTEVIAHYVHEVILPQCDAVVDLHAGGYSLELAPYISMHYLEDEAQREATRAAMESFQAPYALIMREFSGKGLLDYAVEGMGKVFLCAEIGSAGRLEADTLALTLTGARNVLKHFGVLEGAIATCAARGLPPTITMEVPEPAYYHAVSVDGIYESLVTVGETVAAGQPLGQVHFVQYPQQAPVVVTAQRAGILIGRRAPGFVEVGDTVAVIARAVADS